MPQYVQDWDWTEAFQKYGFGDGEDTVHTQEVVEFLESLGYQCEPVGGMHNYFMYNLERGDTEWHPPDDFDHNPREWLPPDLVALLDAKFPIPEGWEE